MKDCEPWSDHPVLHGPGVDLSSLIGFTLRMDGAEMFRNDEYLVYSFSSCFAAGGMIQDVLMYKYPICVLAEREVESDALLSAANAAIADLVAWSFGLAEAGIMPTAGFYGEELSGFRKRFAGEQIAGRWRGAYFSTKADLKARKQMHRFTRYYRCTQLCDQCMAEQFKGTSRHLHYTNMAEDAGYSMSKISHNLYLNMDASNLSPWRNVRGWRLETCSWDLLHNVYLGVGRDFFASVLRILFIQGHFRDFGNDESVVLKKITLEMRQCYREHGLFGQVSRICCFGCLFSRVECGFGLPRLYLPRRKLTLANLHTWGNEDYAELGSKFKAAHVKIMLWWLAKKTQIITDESDGEDTYCFCCVTKLSGESLRSLFPRWLSEHEIYFGVVFSAGFTKRRTTC